VRRLSKSQAVMFFLSELIMIKPNF